jgi:PST family polysaccharide transporter
MATVANQTADNSVPGKKTYGQILKSSAIIGGSSAVNIGLNIVRTKVMALLLGPAGFGLFGVYNAILDLVRSVGGMGINTSGVRQIAEADGSGDKVKLAKTVITLRRVAFLCGAFGALLLVVFSKPISQFSFGDTDHVWMLMLLALAVIFMDISAGQAAVIQGLRKLGDLARMNIRGAIYGSILSIAIVFYFYQQGEPERGIVPALVAVAAMTVLTSWWYARQVRVEPVQMTSAEISTEVSGLLKLGFVFMATALMSMAVVYVVRIIVLRQLGESDAGYFSAAWQLGGIYVGFILSAMGTDFYPRLTAVAKDNVECNRLVNEQTEVGLLMAGPGVLGTLTFAPIVILLFYSDKFAPAVEVLRWICLGMLLRVASWPMGFILGAKGLRKAIFLSELAISLFQIGLAWVCVRQFKVDGAGMAFFGAYVAYGLMIYLIVKSVSGFAWSPENKRIGLLFLVVIAAVFVGWYHLPRYIAVAGSIIATIAMSYYSAKKLCALVPLDRLPKPVRWVAKVLKLSTVNQPS